MMFAGACEGVTGTGDCVHSGWSPHWLMDVATRDFVDGLRNSTLPPDDAVVCPWCFVQRNFDAGVPGFNQQKYDALMDMLWQTTPCARPRYGSRAIDHVHIYDIFAGTGSSYVRENQSPYTGSARHRAEDEFGSDTRPPGHPLGGV